MMSDESLSGESFFTPNEWEAIVLAVRHCLGEPIAVSPAEINPIWRTVSWQD